LSQSRDARQKKKADRFRLCHIAPSPHYHTSSQALKHNSCIGCDGGPRRGPRPNRSACAHARIQSTSLPFPLRQLCREQQCHRASAVVNTKDRGAIKVAT
jgi:hypothetical protein